MSSLEDMISEEDLEAEFTKIKYQNVGVSAKTPSPDNSCSSSRMEAGDGCFQSKPLQNAKLGQGNKSIYVTETTTTNGYDTSESSKVLYEMQATSNIVPKVIPKPRVKTTAAPSKIEFKLHKNKERHCGRCPVGKFKCNHGRNLSKEQKKCKFGCENRKSEEEKRIVGEKSAKTQPSNPNFFQRLKLLFGSKKENKNHEPKPKSCGTQDSSVPPIGESSFFVNIEENVESIEGIPGNDGKPTHQDFSSARQRAAGNLFNDAKGNVVYTFDHGCADFLCSRDNHPDAISRSVEEHTMNYANRFWAEFFGLLHIFVSFFVTFILQAYRFILFSLVNTLVVGILQTTSDYLLKPVLTLLFNGFLQPPFIFLFNILASLRDVLEPIADAINSLMRPLATIGNSLRLIHVSYNNNNKRTVKDV